MGSKKDYNDVMLVKETNFTQVTMILKAKGYLVTEMKNGEFEAISDSEKSSFRKKIKVNQFVYFNDNRIVDVSND